MIHTFVEGVAIYLDNFAIIDLAKGDSARRARFVKAIREGGAELLFSVGNAVELVGPEGGSREWVKGLLREFGAHWFPVEVDTNKVCKREETGIRAPDSFVDKEWLNTFFSTQSKSYADAGKIIPLSGDFFNLDVVIDWLATDKESLVRHNRELVLLC
jgi:hypothetical protein